MNISLSLSLLATAAWAVLRPLSQELKSYALGMGMPTRGSCAFIGITNYHRFVNKKSDGSIHDTQRLQYVQLQADLALMSSVRSISQGADLSTHGAERLPVLQWSTRRSQPVRVCLFGSTESQGVLLRSGTAALKLSVGELLKTYWESYRRVAKTLTETLSRVTRMLQRLPQLLQGCGTVYWRSGIELALL